MEKYKKTAIVVGGSSGIGCETCLRLFNRGWHVVNVSRTPCKNSNIHNIAADAAAGNAPRYPQSPKKPLLLPARGLRPAGETRLRTQ